MSDDEDQQKQVMAVQEEEEEKEEEEACQEPKSPLEVFNERCGKTTVVFWMHPSIQILYVYVEAYLQTAALLFAASLGCLEKVREMVEMRNVPVNAINCDERTALHVAAGNGHIETVRYLLQVGANVHALDRWKMSAVHNSMLLGHVEVSQLLAEKGGLLAQSNVVERMCSSASRGSLQDIQRMVSAGAPVNEGDYDMRTPLHLAAAEGHGDIVEYLVENGVEVNSRDRWGCTPLNDAMRNNHPDVVHMLKNMGGVVTSNTSNVANQLCDAARSGDLEELKRLIENGADPNDCDYDRRTAMHLACAEGYLSIVLYLLEKGTKVNPADRWGHTPLDDAMMNNQKEIEVLLVNKGGVKGALGPGQSNWRIDPEEVVMGNEIGRGSYGTIYRAKWRGLDVAVKKLRGDLGHQRQTALEDITREVALMSTLRHPNLVLFLGACVDNPEEISVTVEYLRGGDLQKVLTDYQTKGEKLPVTRVIKIAHELAVGMAYLHAEGIVHRDLKPSNILFDADRHLKISDFGLSRICPRGSGNEEAYVMTGGTGSYRYMAPEVFRFERYNEKVDVYAYGVILWYVATCRQPFRDVVPKTAAYLVSSKNVRPNINLVKIPWLKTIISNSWNDNPKVRPSFADIIVAIEPALNDPKVCVVS